MSDPTILAWMIAYEPVSAPHNYRDGLPRITIAELAEWIEDMASYAKRLDANHLVSVDAHSGIAKLDENNWPDVVRAPSLDFVRWEDGEGRFIHLTQDDSVDYPLRLFSMEKPVVVAASFTGGSIDQARVSKDYVWQAEELRAIFKVYYEMAVAAGFVVFHWSSDLMTTSRSLPYEGTDYAYTASNRPIAQAFADIAGTLGPRNTTNTSLQFVRVKSR